jgi:glutamate-1-semialdehyde aminotransferase
LSEDNFKQKYPSAEAMTVVTLNMGNGQNITCTLVDNKVFLSTGNKVTVFGAGTTNAKPLFMYAGGTWISEDAKAMKKNRLNTF